MTGPVSAAVRDRARDLVRAELAVRLSHGHDAILRRIADQYRKIVGEALAADPATGKAGQVRAAQRALDRIAHLGVVDFVDQAGRRWNMQSYVEMAVRTAALRARTKAHMDVLRERGEKYVFVPPHAGTCPLCAPFEGRVLAIDEDGTGPLIPYTVAQAIAAGFQHPNCRHILKLWRPGTTIPEPIADPDAYADEQRLRYLERGVRQWKTREAAALTDDTRAKAHAKVEEWQAGIRRHVTDTGAGRVRGREQIDRALTAPATRRPIDTATPRPDDLTAPRVAEQEAQRRADVDREAARGAEESARRTDPVREFAPDELVADYRDRVEVPRDEQRALFGYTGGDFNLINNWLRGGSRDDDYFVDEAKPQSDLVATLARRYEMPGTATARRRVYDNAIPDDMVVGGTWSEPGFSSTTLAGTDTVEFRHYPVEMVIKVPKGMPAIVVNATGKGVEAENELILPPGTRFTMLSDVPVDGVRRVTLLASPPGVA